ncbi:antizyme inhibitor 1b [Brienomyrus brachyistius]|uniref:antizyme inhibitor 1b n=1 Tax=Brienomyrus brachyistius TaxID=42636 RepID=UPI0020B26B7F|nr:antizyme inhibitor 1b [Brienomyrus brachyistius]
MKGFADEPNYSIELLQGSTTLCDVIDSHIYEQALAEKNAFLVADLGVLVRQHFRWQTSMAPIQSYYSVRCNSSPAVVEVLAALGVGFVCSNKNELVLVQNFGVAPENIIFSAVCKQLSHLKYAAKNGVDTLTCDNETEMRKIARCHPGAKLLLQITAEAPGEVEATSMTFGATLKGCRGLLECAQELGMQVVGVKFHIPSSCRDIQAYTHAVADARCVFDMGAEFGYDMNILDIGGGFTGSEDQLEQIRGAIQPQLERYFSPLCGFTIIAEPGAFYVSPSFTLAVNIIGKKVVARDRCGRPCDDLSPNDEPEFLYYMNDGVYGSFSSKLLDDIIPAPSVHKVALLEEPVFSSSLWGPSSDALDQVVDHCLLPELNVGDWLLFRNMGAQSVSEQAAYTSVESLPIYHVISEHDWYEMQDAGFGLDTPMRNLLLGPYSFPFNQQEDAFSTPA